MSERQYKSERHNALESQFPSDPMSYRLNYKPLPAVPITWWRRVLRKLLELMT